MKTKIIKRNFSKKELVAWLNRVKGIDLVSINCNLWSGFSVEYKPCDTYCNLAVLTNEFKQVLEKTDWFINQHICLRNIQDYSALYHLYLTYPEGYVHKNTTSYKQVFYDNVEITDRYDYGIKAIVETTGNVTTTTYLNPGKIVITETFLTENAAPLKYSDLILDFIAAYSKNLKGGC